MNDTASTRAAAQRATEFFENITPADVARLDAVYATRAYFRDPRR